MSRPGDIAGDQLRAVVERIENIDEEIKELTEAKRKSISRPRGTASTSRNFREVIRVRKQDQQERDELETLLEDYLQAIKGASLWQRLEQRLQQRRLDRGGGALAFDQ